jgi:hypothetical protein
MEPQEIVSNPLPLLDGSFTASSGQNTSPVVSGSKAEVPNTKLDQKFPQTIIAHETISQSLDTQSRKIKGSYSFEQMGALKIGSFEFGVSGEVAISPDGISARNVNGENTFTLDGTTGDATFKGVISAGSFIGVNGSFVVEEASNGNPREVLYNDGLPAIVIGDPS